MAKLLMGDYYVRGKKEKAKALDDFCQNMMGKVLTYIFGGEIKFRDITLYSSTPRHSPQISNLSSAKNPANKVSIDNNHFNPFSPLHPNVQSPKTPPSTLPGRAQEGHATISEI